jgi:hypothetical protein
MGFADVVFWLLLLAMVGVVIATIVHGSFTRDGGAAPGALTSLHDFAPADKQRAFEIVAEERSGKKWMEQESGKTKEPEAESPPPSDSGSNDDPGGAADPLTPPS